MLYIIFSDYSMSEYILAPLQQMSGVKLIRYEQRAKALRLHIARFIRTYLCHHAGFMSNMIFTPSLCRSIKEIGSNDRVLLFGIDTLKDLLIIHDEIKSVQKQVFLWNPLRARIHTALSRWYFVRTLSKTCMDISTYDPWDAIHYHFKLVRQVYRFPSEPTNITCSPMNDIFCIMNDKGRGKQLVEMVRLFMKAGLTMDMHIVKDKQTKYQEELQPYYSYKRMGYSEVLTHISHSRCILEILQQGQEGHSLRALEALFMNKKLITNNHNIKDADFYKRSNVLIIDRFTTPADITAFMSESYQPISSEIIKNYEINTWIQTFM